MLDKSQAADQFWLVNGEPFAALTPNDRGLAYGDGLFETMRVINGQCVLQAMHFERLEEGCRRIGINISISDIHREFQQFVALVATKMPVTRGIIKLIVTRGVGGQGYTPLENAGSSVIWQWLPLSVSVNQAANGVTLALSDVRLAAQPMLAGIKHLNRLEYVLAARHAPVGEIPLLLSSDGAVIETLSHNIFLVKNGVLFTPLLVNCGVAGILRKLVIQRLANDIGLSVREAHVSLDDLNNACEVIIGNSVRGFWPVTHLKLSGNLQRWPIGSICRKLQQSHQYFEDQALNV